MIPFFKIKSESSHGSGIYLSILLKIIKIGLFKLFKSSKIWLTASIWFSKFWWEMSTTWSNKSDSFPAHKHDERILDDKGNVLEPIQEETYFYKFQKKEAYAIQQVYTKDKSLDEIIRAKHNDIVMIPKGFHPVVADHGFHCYYLNFLAGTDQCLENTTDPDHEWIYNSWKTKDKRLPLVTPSMNNQ